MTQMITNRTNLVQALIVRNEFVLGDYLKRSFGIAMVSHGQ